MQIGTLNLGRSIVYLERSYQLDMSSVQTALLTGPCQRDSPEHLNRVNYLG